ncbi:MAG: cytochrome c oxidase subunit 4 [Gammaproteobacteria bacterium]|jgi:cytochrome c oxidase subunit 4
MGIYFCSFLSLVIQQESIKSENIIVSLGGGMVENTQVQVDEHGHQEHPVSLYLKIWVLLFILSGFSYMVDFMHLEGLLRWSLILLFMFLKAGLIISVFMHMMWERMALICAILIPPLALTLFIGIMAIESNYTFFSRLMFFTGS